MEINGFKLTERAQMAIRYAQESSMEFGSGVVGTEHLLIGLVREGGGIAAKVLASRGVTREELQAVVSKYYRNSANGYHTRIEFTPRTKNVLELSVREDVYKRQAFPRNKCADFLANRDRNEPQAVKKPLPRV